jgi:hypothetical protein
MPSGIYRFPEHAKPTRSDSNRPSLPVTIRTRLRRGRLDRELAAGADPAATVELTLRAEQLVSSKERARIANAIVETLGEARRNEPVSVRAHGERAAVRDSADELLRLVLRLREDGPVELRGLATTARLVDDKQSPIRRDDAGEMREAIRSALSALEPTREPAADLHARAA